jgi:hypothetical protein
LFDATTGQLLDSFLNPSLGVQGFFANGMEFLNDSHVVISDPFDDTGGEDAGALYVFKVTGIPEPTTSALALAALCLAMSRRLSF